MSILYLLTVQYLLDLTTVGKIIVACTFHLAVEDEDHDSEDAGDELGGLFRVSRPDKESKQKANGLDCSKFLVEAPRDWDLEEVMPLGPCSSVAYPILVMSWLCLIHYCRVVIETDLRELWPEYCIFCCLLLLGVFVS